MPMYEYQCSACGTRFERLSRARVEPDVRCVCGSSKVERIWYSRVAVAHGGGTAGEAESCAEPGGCCGGACAMEEA